MRTALDATGISGDQGNPLIHRDTAPRTALPENGAFPGDELQRKVANAAEVLGEACRDEPRADQIGLPRSDRVIVDTVGPAEVVKIDPQHHRWAFSGPIAWWSWRWRTSIGGRNG